MKIFDLDRGAPVSSPAAPLSIALGSFDGVHIGHRELIRRAQDAGDAAPAVWTFDANPFGVPYLTSLAEKLALFREYGVKYALVSSFEEIRDLSPGEFVDALKSRGAARAVCGYNFTFGKDKSGDSGTLRELCAVRGMACEVVGRVTAGGQPVSSTRIRLALADGGTETAAALLGRYYSFTAPVTHGSEIARTLGYPTANQTVPEGRVRLRRGVYVTRALGRPSITNAGIRPTVVTDGGVVCETHIIGCHEDLYGSDLKVEFISFLRDERRFDSLDALKAQLELDVAGAAGFFRCGNV
ncbi:MAG: riboflavin biosynthesis protein RibF [Clostridia bacterium]|nr:riboflavin biosynthesis protein RibF [Clostridia bacterium]